MSKDRPPVLDVVVPEPPEPKEFHKGFAVRRVNGRVELLARIDVEDEAHVKTVLNVEPRLALELGDMLKLAGWNELAAQEEKKPCP